MTSNLPAKVQRELRASHAGETGAVWIYKGILAGNRWLRRSNVQEFAKHHLDTEQKHLELFNSQTSLFRRSLFLPLWRLSGFFTGFIPALLSESWVFYTIYRVEHFVDLHYQRQIEALSPILKNKHPGLIKMLEQCQDDEIAHRDEALSCMKASPTPLIKFWGLCVSKGSHFAAITAKYL